MAAQTPRHYKTVDELTPDEHAQVIAAEHRNEAPPRFETDDYKQARAEALRDAGFDDDAEDDDALEDMSVEQHLAQIRRHQP
jgi:hypothetical protein